MRQAREYNYRAMAMSLGPPAPVPVKGAQRGKRSCWRKWGASLLRFMVGAASRACRSVRDVAKTLSVAKLSASAKTQCRKNPPSQNQFLRRATAIASLT